MTRPGQSNNKATPVLMGVLMSVCIIFLQVGFTYYVSFQTLAVLLILVVVFKGRPAFVNVGFVLLSGLIFVAFLTLTALTVPIAISENSANIFNTFVGVVAYAVLIISAPNLAFRSPDFLLRFFNFVSAATILIIVALICVVDLEVFPLFTRETLMLQNTTLITNYTTLDVLTDNFAYLHDAGLKSNMDLFYGEQSFLAIVLFACVTCRLVCGKLMQKMGLVTELINKGRYRGRGMRAFVTRHGKAAVVALGLGAMIYIQSFSSIFYVMIACFSLLMSSKRRMVDIELKPTSLLIMLVVLLALGKIAWSASDYYAHRFTTVSDSGSFDQRFSSIFDFGMQEYILGIGDVAKMPKVGFQNGILYIIAISGLGGIGLMAFLFRRIYVLARPLGMAVLTLACVLGAFSQNGGIFSPNKFVILALVLMPLACGNHVLFRRRSTNAQLPMVAGDASVAD